MCFSFFLLFRFSARWRLVRPLPNDMQRVLRYRAFIPISFSRVHLLNRESIIYFIQISDSPQSSPNPGESREEVVQCISDGATLLKQDASADDDAAARIGALLDVNKLYLFIYFIYFIYLFIYLF